MALAKDLDLEAGADRENIDVALARGKLNAGESAVLVFVKLQAGFQKSEVLDEIVLKVPLERELSRSEVIFLGGLLGEIVRLGDTVRNICLKIGFVAGGRVFLGIPQAEFARAQLEELVPARVWLYRGVMPTLGEFTDMPSTCNPTVLLLMSG
ncbi:MAG: hypothetical protein OXC14_02250 [Rhodospirillaceae bacterium]|nr:hypothetical protein [Rhodospirillaceae bacterium]